MPTSTSVTVRCTGCGRVLAEYPRLALDPRTRARVQAHARDLFDWHRREERDCGAGQPVVAEVVRRGA